MHDFERETALTQTGVDEFTGRVSSAWNIGDNPNGGYLASIALAAVRSSQAQEPLSVTVHYLRPGIGNAACRVSCATLRQGRTLRNVRATLEQDSKRRLELMAVLGALDAPMGVADRIDFAPPPLPRPEDCVPRSGETQGIHLPIMERLDVRLHPEHAVAGHSAQPEVRGWIRFRDGRQPNAAALLLFADAFPPSPFASLGVVGWVPTIELTLHVLRAPAPGWIRAAFRTDSLHNGRMIETGALWDAADNLVAQSRQLGLVTARSN